MRKIVKWCFVALFGLLLAILIAFQSQTVKQYAVKTIISYAEEKSGWKISVANFEGLLPLQLRFNKLQLTSPSNNQVNIDNLFVVISPLQALRGNLQIHYFQASGISTNKTSLPVTLEGNLSIKPKKLTKGEIFFKHISGQAIANSVQFDISKERAFYTFKEPEKGFLAHLAKSPFDLPHELTLQREGMNGTFSLKSCLPNQKTNRFGLSGKLKFNSNTNFAIEEGKALIFSADGFAIPVGILSGTGKFEHNDYKLNLGLDKLSYFDAFHGSATADFDLSLKGNPELTWQIQSPEFSALQYTVQNINHRGTLRRDAEGMVGSCSLSGNMDMQDFHASVNLATVADVLSLSQIDLGFSSSTITGALDIHRNEKLVRGHLNGQFPDLSVFSSLLEQDMQGNIHFDTELSAEAALYAYDDSGEMNYTQNINLNVEGSRLAFGPIKMGKLSLEKKMTFPKMTFYPKGKIVVNIEQGEFTKWNVDELVAETDVDFLKSEWPYRISFKGKRSDLVEVHSEGKWYLEDLENVFSAKDSVGCQIDVDTFNGQLSKQTFSLQNPVRFTAEKLNKEIIALAITPFHVTLGPGNIEGEVQLKTNQAKCNLKAREIPIELLSLFDTSFPFTGYLQADADLHGTSTELLGSIRTTIDDIHVHEGNRDLLPPLKGLFDLELQHEKLSATGTLHSQLTQPINLNAEFPLRLSLLPLMIVLDKEKPLNAHFTGAGEIAPLLQLLMSDTTSITGTLATSLDIIGNINYPIITGKAELTNGSYESLTSGAVFKNIHGTLVGDGPHLQLTNLRAEDSENGQITATGSMIADFENAFPFDFAFKIDNVTLLHLDYANIKSSGEIHYKGNFIDKTIEGELTVDNATLRLPSEVPANLHALDVRYINLPKHAPPPTHYVMSSKKKTGPIGLNIKLNVPKNAFVSNKDLSTQWWGSILFTGTDAEPLLNGNLELLQGEFKFNGQKFTLHNGMINFAGNPVDKTTLHVTAEQQIEDVKAEIVLKGPIRKPVISFRSNPPMSQKEILSWILFGQGTNEITPTQSEELSQSIISLGNKGKSNDDLLSRIKHSFGIDRIDISKKQSADADDVSLKVGKYIAKGLFLSVNRSINTDTNQVGIEANLSRNFRAQAQMDDKSEGKMILKWQKDY